MSIQQGKRLEEKARQYLQKKGLAWVESNYRCRLGEIDLIFNDVDYLVFVEVRSRTSSFSGSALASVDYRKQQKLLKTASFYLSSKRLHNKRPVRFDVVAFDGVPERLTWIKNAFGA